MALVGRRHSHHSQNSSQKGFDEERVDHLDIAVTHKRSGSGSSGSSSEMNPEQRHLETELVIQQMLPKLAQKVSMMEVSSPEVLRVTSAFRAFENFAVALRTGCDCDFYYKSRQQLRIGTFWSHSWHGGHWKKILTLIIFYKGTAAVTLALLAGIVTMLLISFQILPSPDRGMDDPEIHWSIWSLAAGFIVVTLVMAFWRPQTPVFFDRLCISQTDHDLKTQAIFSLAGLLRSSDTMLILWDPTWTDRLWCLFELAAFLKSKQASQEAKRLIIKPTFLGPISVGAFITVWVAALPAVMIPVDGPTGGSEVSTDGQKYHPAAIIPGAVGVLLVGGAVAMTAISSVRSYFRDLDVMKQQLLSISFDSVRSACCDQNHVSPSGEPMLCDRKIVKECVNIWFGSQQAFEEAVRSEVLEILNTDLNEKVFNTSFCVGITSPIMLAFLDMSGSYARSARTWPLWGHPGFLLLLEGLLTWLLAFPASIHVMGYLCRICRHRPKSLCLEFAKNAAATLASTTWPMCIVISYFWTRLIIVPSELHRAGAFSLCMFVYCSGCYFAAFLMKQLLKRPGW